MPVRGGAAGAAGGGARRRETRPSLEVPRIVIAPSLAPLCDRRVRALPAAGSRSRACASTPSASAFKDGRRRHPAPRRRSGGARARRQHRPARDRRAASSGSTTSASPSTSTCPDFRGRLQGRRRPGPAAARLLRSGRRALRHAPPLPIGTRRSTWSLDRAPAHASSRPASTREATDLAYTGRLRFSGRPPGRSSTSRVRWTSGLLDQHVLRTGLRPRGAARFDGTLSVDGSRLAHRRAAWRARRPFRRRAPCPATRATWPGTAEGAPPARAGRSTPSAAAARSTSRSPRRRTCPPASAAAAAASTPRALVAAGLRHRAPPAWAPRPPGEVDVAWPRGPTRGSPGRVRARPRARGDDGRTPLSGRFEWRAEDGVQTVEAGGPADPGHRSARLDGPDRRARPHGPRGDARTAPTSAATDDLLTRLRRALGNTEAAGRGLLGRRARSRAAGGARSTPRCSRAASPAGTWATAASTGGARSGSGVGGRARGALAFAGAAPRRSGAVAGRPHARPATSASDDAMDVQLRLKDWPAADLVQGPGLGSRRRRARSPARRPSAGRRSAPDGEARVTSRGGRYYGVPTTSPGGDALGTGGRPRSRRGPRARGRRPLAFRGSLTDDGVYDGEAEVTERRAGASSSTSLPPDVALRRPALGTRPAPGDARPAPPHRDACARPRVFLGDEGVGALEARLRGTGDGAGRRSRPAAAPRAWTSSCRGKVGAAAPYEAR